MKRRFAFAKFIFGTLLALPCEAQDLPKVIQPSPTAASLFRFQDYPMDYSTGLPNITIPIYEIKSGSLRLPISISNHVSGRRVSDQNGPIALGWSLNAGGMISRTVHGSVDFGTLGASYPFPTSLSGANTVLPAGLAYVEKISHFDKNPDLAPSGSWMDSEYDVFSYSFGGESGKLVFKDSMGVKIPVLLPFKPYKVIPHVSSELWGIDIIDDAGITYVYTAGDQYSALSVAVTSGYPIKYIISADKKDTISFFYSYFDEKRSNVSQQIIFSDYFNPQNFISQDELAYPQPPSPDNYQVSRLTEIVFRNGRIVFNLASSSSKYESIQIKNEQGHTIKSILFKRSFLEWNFEISPLSLERLDSLVFQDQMSFSIEKHSFEYYPNLFVGGQSTINVRHRDWWGYYNASGVDQMIPYYGNLEYQQHSFSPIFFDRSVGYLYAQREPNLDALKSGMIKKVKYPTGGSTEFMYENNKYQSALNSQVKFGPGMRIAQIKTDDNNGNISYKTYKYGHEESGYGTIDLEPQMSTMSNLQYMQYFARPGYQEFAGYYRQRIFYSDFKPELSTIAERPVIYKEVAEYNGSVSDNLGKTVYTYDTVVWTINNLASLSALHPKMHIADFNYWNQTSLVSKTDFKRVESGETVTYARVKKTHHRYASTILEYVRGLHVQKNHIYPQTERITSKFAEEEAVIQGNYGIYAVGEYRILSGFKNLTSTEDTLFNDDNTIIATKTQYVYNALQLVNTTTTFGSDGVPIVRDLKYASDLTGDATYGSISATMVTKNMVGISVEESEFKNTTHLTSKRTKYKDWGNNIISPEYVETKTLANPFEIRLRYHSYDDRGNPTSVSKEGDIRQSYIWGYNKNYPVVQVAGADYATIAGFVNQTVLNSSQSSDQQIRTELNNIRTALANTNAQVTSYTYKPLTGMTSQTDANGKTSYYTYDAYGRLAFIKDNNGNVLKKLCYTYKGETENCNLFFSEDKSATYYSQWCTGTPNAYYVSVPQGMFSSTTSQGAANDLAVQYGQQQANNYGTCTNPQVVVNYNNGVGYDYQVTLFNTGTGQSYNFPLPMYGSGGLGQVPIGSYNVTFYSYSDSNLRGFSAGCQYDSGNAPKTLYNVSIGSSCNTIGIN